VVVMVVRTVPEGSMPVWSEVVLMSMVSVQIIFKMFSKVIIFTIVMLVVIVVFIMICNVVFVVVVVMAIVVIVVWVGCTVVRGTWFSIFVVRPGIGGHVLIPELSKSNNAYPLWSWEGG
jgi:fatty acid desaturase